IDTSNKTLWDLKEQVSERFGFEDTSGLTINVTSFSYRQGLPREADLVFDARFLTNPHYVDALRPLTGEDVEVGAYVAADSDFPAFMNSLTGMMAILLPRYEAEGKSYLTIAVGCTGGRHRSVYVARRLVEWLENQGRPVYIHHRDMASGGGRNML
ncbi:MAG: RNase adaptor protein RapZ, partial [Proteobacteria bacterium]|nr:RNase adaptor protein RapZ [Pseudomonadota bacterium]